MKVGLALVVVMFFAPGIIWAQEVDERYVEIYNWIQKADALGDAGQKAEAVRMYQQAQTGLQSLHAGYPLWNEKVISYRLKYIAEKLAALGPQTNAPPAKVEGGDSNAATNQIKALQEQLDRLQGQNSLLEAKLREALSIQPAATDPRQLAQAQQRITSLEKERDLFRVALEEEKKKLIDPVVALRERQILADAERRLAEQISISTGFREQNDSLRAQLEDARRQPATDSNLQLQLANATMAALRATNIALRTERILLEGRLAELGNPAGAGANESSAMRQLRQERDDLKAKLDQAMVQLGSGQNAASGAGAMSAQKELEEIRARLRVYEAQQIPYTSEELAFFKRSDLNVELKEKPQVSAPQRQELPAGAGRLMADAQKALANGRYDEAEKILQQVLRQDEQNVYTLANLASVQMEQKRWDEAEKNLQRALAVQPRDPASLFLMGWLKYEQKNYDEALKYLSLAAQILPNEARTQYFLGKTLIEKGNRGPAEMALRKAVQLKPGWGDAHHALAVVYASQNPPFIELAQWHYQKALTGGFLRDTELEKWIEQKKAASPP